MILIKFYRYFKSNAKEVRVLEIVKSWLNIDDFRSNTPNAGRLGSIKIYLVQELKLTPYNKSIQFKKNI